MTIAEVAKRYELTQDTLRYYEKMKLIPPIKRSKGGIRQYSEDDCNWISFIKCMRSAGVSIETLIEYVRLFYIGDETIAERKQLLIDERERISRQIAELNDVLTRLDRKIDGYDKRVSHCERKLRTE